MARRVVWSPRALADVESIAAYIAVDSAYYATTVVRRIIELTRSLADFPLAGRKVPEFDNQDIRELLVYSYRIIYLVEGDQVTIASVIHGRQML